MVARRPDYGKAAFYAYAHPAPEGFADGSCRRRPPLGRGDGPVPPRLGGRARERDPHAAALEFLRSAFHHACLVCDWDPALRRAPKARRRRSSRRSAHRRTVTPPFSNGS